MSGDNSFESSKEQLSRRDFLKGAGGVGASLLIPPGKKGAREVFLKPGSTERAEKLELSLWEQEKRGVIDGLVNSGQVEFIPLADFGQTFKKKDEGLHRERLATAREFLKSEFDLDFEGVGTHWDLMGLAERRYEELLEKGIYSLAVDLTKEETDEFLTKLAGWIAGRNASQETSEFILNQAYLTTSIENGARSQNPICHGDRFYPAGGDGPFNPLLDDPKHDGRYWARWIKAKGAESEQLVVSFRAFDGQAALKVPANTARHDYVLNAYVGMGIGLEHLLGMAADPRWQGLLKAAVMENPEVDRRSVLASCSWMAYHFGRRQFEENFLAEPELAEKPAKILKSRRVGDLMEIGLRFDRQKRWQDKDYIDQGFTLGSRELEFYYNTPRRYREWVLGKEKRDQELVLAKKELLTSQPEVAKALEAYQEARKQYQEDKRTHLTLEGDTLGWQKARERFNQAQAKFSYTVLARDETREFFFEEATRGFEDELFGSSFGKTAPEKGKVAAFSKRLKEYGQRVQPLLEKGEEAWAELYGNLLETEGWVDNVGEKEWVDYFSLEDIFFDYLPQGAEVVFGQELERVWQNLDWCLESILEKNDLEGFLRRDPVKQAEKRERVGHFTNALDQYCGTSPTEPEKRGQLGAEVTYFLFQEPKLWQPFSFWLAEAFKAGEPDKEASLEQKELVEGFPAALSDLPEQMAPFWEKGLEGWQNFVKQMMKEDKGADYPKVDARRFLYFGLPEMVEEGMRFSAEGPIKLDWISKVVFAKRMEYFQTEQKELADRFRQGQRRKKWPR
jgi:hypothetical protein